MDFRSATPLVVEAAGGWARRFHRGREKKWVVVVWVVVVVVVTWVVVVVSAAKAAGSCAVWSYGGGGGVAGRSESVDLADLACGALLPRWNRPTMRASPARNWSQGGRVRRG